MTRELWKGNEAIAEAAVRAGLEAYFGYPITPQTEILEYLSRRMPELGRAFVQAESELGAINMVYGAACAGVRVMSTSSSPGVSLMMEGLSYIAGTEVPAVLVNVMRGGPGLGNIAPAQADYNQAVHGGGIQARYVRRRANGTIRGSGGGAAGRAAHGFGLPPVLPRREPGHRRHRGWLRPWCPHAGHPGCRDGQGAQDCREHHSGGSHRLGNANVRS